MTTCTCAILYAFLLWYSNARWCNTLLDNYNRKGYMACVVSGAFSHIYIVDI